MSLLIFVIYFIDLFKLFLFYLFLSCLFAWEPFLCFLVASGTFFVVAIKSTRVRRRDKKEKWITDKVKLRRKRLYIWRFYFCTFLKFILSVGLIPFQLYAASEVCLFTFYIAYDFTLLCLCVVNISIIYYVQLFILNSSTVTYKDECGEEVDK